MVMQNLGGQTKRIMVFSELAYLPLQEELIVRFSPGIIYVSVDLHLNGFEV